MVPRISMLIGIDTIGNVYVSLYQSNSNNKLMELVLINLVRKLDQQRKNWRKDTVVL